MDTQSFLANLITSMSLIDDKIEFKKESQKNDLEKWINTHKMKVGSVGGLTGLLGGPAGLLLEGADMGYLASIMGRLCFGIGHIKRKSVNYEVDMEGILAIWGGAGKGIKKYELKNKAKEHYGEDIIYNEELFNLYISQIKVNHKLILNDEYSPINQNIRSILLASSKGAIKISGKTALKTGLKVGTKMLGKKIGVKISPKLLAKASAKLSAKVATKMSTKWIPVIGGVTSAAINVWVLDTLAEAAKEYYNSDYILLSSDICRETFNDATASLKDISEESIEFFS